MPLPDAKPQTLIVEPQINLKKEKRNKNNSRKKIRLGKK
jgi:hypothetical protein